MEPIKFIIATRHKEGEFQERSATWRSLAVTGHPPMQVQFFPENKIGLPEAYNSIIRAAAQDPCILVFIHDDVLITDLYLIEKIRQSLQVFDVVGVAGNIRRAPKQPNWFLIDNQLTWDDRANLSGSIGHGQGFPPSHIDIFGPAPQPVKLLDGVMLAVRSSTLFEHKLCFDERFKFHFYDTDFCRQAEALGLKMGTWPISLIHQSAGTIDLSWHEALNAYLAKWGS
jgi:GT2 family glycosyltransferase